MRFEGKFKSWHDDRGFGFIVTFWFTVVCNVTAFTLLHSPIVNFVSF